jgi:hypothetical protein
MKRTMFVSIASLTSVGTLCLACSIYSLGLLGATWDDLPNRIKDCFMQSAKLRHMQDQTISNVIYGLGLLKVNWDELDKEFRDVLLENLGRIEAFQGNVPQHISNTLWGSAKMDASWSQMPMENLQDAIVKGASMMSPQVIYFGQFYLFISK